jgi:hypothetical protein
MDKIEANAACTKLERFKRAHDKGQSTLAWTKAADQSAITKAEDQLPALQAAIPRITSTAGENFTATIDRRTRTKRPEAVAAIAEWIRTHTPEYGNYYRQQQDSGSWEPSAATSCRYATRPVVHGSAPIRTSP